MDLHRMSTFTLSKESVYRRVKAIARTTMGADWTWGKEPYTRENPPPSVRIEVTFPSEAAPSLLQFSSLHANLVLQRNIPRRAIEEARNPPNQWPENRTEEDEVDFYLVEDLPRSNVPRRVRIISSIIFLSCPTEIAIVTTAKF